MSGPKSRLAPVKDEIIEMRREGMSLQEIGDQFGVSREMIRLVCLERGVTKPMWSLAAYRRLFDAVGVAARHTLREQRGGCLSVHGSLGRYKRGCSCESCTEANRLHMAALKGRKPPRHGTPSAYFNFGCRCDRCKAAGAFKNRASYRLRRMRGIA